MALEQEIEGIREGIKAGRFTNEAAVYRELSCACSTLSDGRPTIRKSSGPNMRLAVAC
jgi:hypothetical protein